MSTAFTQTQRGELRRRRVSVDEAQRQIDLLRDGVSPLRLLRPATVGNALEEHLVNGSMAGWYTLMVEVPSETFSPVKTVFDLLRPMHQSSMRKAA